MKGSPIDRSRRLANNQSFPTDFTGISYNVGFWNSRGKPSLDVYLWIAANETARNKQIFDELSGYQDEIAGKLSGVTWDRRNNMRMCSIYFSRGGSIASPEEDLKGQVIFQGPLGTGKTYVARRIAQWYREQGGDYQIVQFHPSYTYEDFVEGFRPARTSDGQVGYDLVKGPLPLMAERARVNPDATFILVIDEINRGNVAKVLGELYFLLEYRDEAVTLQYSHEPFRLPKNLWFIGTMNTTDRSIALVDAALRRRFYFFGLYPDEPPVQGLLSRWLAREHIDAPWVADLVEAANRKLDDRHLGIGPSHFMRKDPPLDAARVRFIWEQAVIPTSRNNVSAMRTG